MIERVLDELNERRSKRPISQEAFHKWKNQTITKRLFEDIELGVFSSFLDDLPEDDPDAALTQAMLRQGGKQLAESILEWAPEGCEVSEDED